ncbi:MAG: uroporphyrinogen decarboxylase, partial [Deltaproteobacteria bacterium]|nr:uroporphyrinogen decarboxylase [Deltaproteobacteria bacterium]
MRFLDACAGRPVDTTPIWVMRQAGRYLPEYMDLRSRSSFVEMCRTPSLAAEATLQPIRRFDLDAAIIFSDILVPVEAMGVPVEFIPEPRLPHPVRTREDVAALRTLDPLEDTGFVMEALGSVRSSLEPSRALIGFAGAPYTVATYMVEGGGSKSYLETRTMMMQNTVAFTDLLQRIADAMAVYLEAQIDAGADAVQLFDSWAGSLSPSEFRRFALDPARSVIERVKEKGVPVIYFVNGVAGVLEDIPSSGADVIGIDYRIDLDRAIDRLGPNAVVQGNLDPTLMLGPADRIRTVASDIVRAGMKAKGHVFNLGHGILRTTPIENMEALVDEVHRAG